jgi:hypothetical protein
MYTLNLCVGFTSVFGAHVVCGGSVYTTRVYALGDVYLHALLKYVVKFFSPVWTFG